jgi:peroxiredoxin
LAVSDAAEPKKEIPMLRVLMFVLAIAGAPMAAALAQATMPGAAAPSFSLTDLDGRKIALADLRGKYVVLEWTNPSCPFVQKHYGSGNMQSLQKRFAAEGVVWLTINSTAASHPEYLKPAEQKAWLQQQGAVPTIAALDADGTVGRVYGAKTTPHMYIIDPKGVLVYAGAIDDKRSANPADVTTARNFVIQALTEVRAGKAVSSAFTTPYGCSVKYAD